MPTKKNSVHTGTATNENMSVAFRASRVLRADTYRCTTVCSPE